MNIEGNEMMRSKQDEATQGEKTFSDVLPLVSAHEQKVLEAILDKAQVKMTSTIRSEKGNEVLVLATINKYFNLAEKLLESGANVYAKVGEQSLLSYAAERGLDNIVSLLTKYGADRFLADEPENALSSAVLQARMNAVRILLAKTPYNPDKDRSSFIGAAMCRDTTLIKEMMKRASHQERDFIDALKKAILWNVHETMKLLMDTMSASSIKEAVSSCTNLSNLVTIQLLLKKLIEISDKDRSVNLADSIEKLKCIETKLLPLPCIIYQLDGLLFNDAIYCLYHLAENSEKGKEYKSHGLQLTANISGLYEPLSKDKMGSELYHQSSLNRVGSIGYLDLDIRVLSYNELDLSYYLRHYNLCAQDVKLTLDGLKKSATFSGNNTNINQLLSTQSYITMKATPSSEVATSTSQLSFFAAQSSSSQSQSLVSQPKP